MQGAYINSDYKESPTSESGDIIITITIEAKQVRDVMINDVENDFVQTPVPHDEGDKRIIINIWGALVNIPWYISPDI